MGDYNYKISVNKVLTDDSLTYEGIEITAKRGETLQQFADRINEVAGVEIAIVTGNPKHLIKDE